MLSVLGYFKLVSFGLPAFFVSVDVNWSRSGLKLLSFCLMLDMSRATLNLFLLKAIFV